MTHTLRAGMVRVLRGPSVSEAVHFSSPGQQSLLPYNQRKSFQRSTSSILDSQLDVETVDPGQPE